MEKQIKQADVDTTLGDTEQRRDSDTSQISVTSGNIHWFSTNYYEKYR